ncbi:MAG: carboxypeptidase-like regulatory domain-containing protein [Sphingobacterium sp.]
MSGQVVDRESKSPIEGVSLQIRSFDKELGAFTDSNGYFRVQLKKEMKYDFILSFIGKEDYEMSIIAINDTTFNIYMQPEPQILGEVIIEAQKKLIESKIDRLVYNINNDPLAKSLTTEELIKRIPLLRLRDNSLSIIGKGNVLISVDGKMQQINSNELLPFLNNFDPTNLKSVEVITSPPSNFSAEGNAGILNIVTNTKVSSEENWNASIRSTFVQRSKPGLDNGLSVNYNKNRFSASANINYTLTQMKADLTAEGNNVQCKSSAKSGHDNLES